jgi:hypothetical protein
MKKLIFLIVCACTLASCEKEPEPIVLTLSNQSMVLYHSDKNNIGATTNSVNPLTYTTSDKYVAKVDAMGNVEAGVIGKADITVSNGEMTRICKVEVKAKYSYFPEPFLKWGALKNEVKANVLTGTRYETSSVLAYTYNESNKLTAFIYYYLFETDGKLNSVGLEFSLLSAYATNLVEFLSERYIPIGYEGKLFMFINKEQNLSVIADLNYNTNGTIMIIFFPYTGQPVLKSVMNLKEEINLLPEIIKEALDKTSDSNS